MIIWFFIMKIFPLKLVMRLQHLKVSYHMHNATLISDGVVKMIFVPKDTPATDTSKSHLPTHISVVNNAVFYGYKCGSAQSVTLIKRGEFSPTDTLCTLTLSVVNMLCHGYKRRKRQI